jgi:hypothetical protein
MLCKAFQRSFFLLIVSADWENEIPLLWIRSKDSIEKAVIIHKTAFRLQKLTGWTGQNGRKYGKLERALIL